MVRGMLMGLMLAGLCGAALATPGDARMKPDRIAYKCTMKGSSVDDWIQPLIFIAHDRTSGRVVVSDAMILGFNDGQPVEGRVATDNGKRTTFAWDVKVKLRVSPVTLSFRGTYVKATGQFSVLANPSGHGNSLTGGGRCQVDRLEG